MSYEDRQDLLGHKSGRITTHYSAAELENLIEAANRVCGENSRTGIVEAKGGCGGVNIRTGMAGGGSSGQGLCDFL